MYLPVCHGLLNARIGMYSTLQDKNYYGGSFPLISECYTDNGTTGGYDVIDLNEIAYRAVTPTKSVCTEYYIWPFTTPSIRQTRSSTISIRFPMCRTIRNQIFWEKPFLSGSRHFDLLRLYGEHWDRTSPILAS